MSTSIRCYTGMWTDNFLIDTQSVETVKLLVRDDLRQASNIKNES